MKKIFVVIYLIVMLAGCSDRPVRDPNNVLTLIPDKEFLTYARSQMGEWDTDGDGTLSPAEAAAVVKMDCGTLGIKSMAGIENFTGLNEFYCHLNQLETLDISALSALEYFNCRGNLLTSLDTSNNTRLVKLSCFDNLLEGLNVSQNSGLRAIWCYGNPGKEGIFRIEAWFAHENLRPAAAGEQINDFTIEPWTMADGEVVTPEYFVR